MIGPAEQSLTQLLMKIVRLLVGFIIPQINFNTKLLGALIDHADKSGITIEEMRELSGHLKEMTDALKGISSSLDEGQ